MGETLPENGVVFRFWKKLIANQQNHLIVLLALPEERRPFVIGTYKA